MEGRGLKAVVTGGSRGIGYAIAQHLLNDGCAVIVTGTTENGSCPEGAQYHAVDFLDKAAVENFCAFLQKLDIDILVNNAGINKIGEFTSIALDDFDDILQVNLRAPFQLCQAVIPRMRENGWGRIVNITSIFGNVTKEYRAPYSASKFGLSGMTAAMAAEVAEYGILANCVAPGFIDTDLTRNVLGETGMSDLKQRIPIKRLGQVGEIAGYVSWLVSSQNTYISGQNLMIDGGFTSV